MAMMCGLTEECKKNRPRTPCIHEWMMTIVIAGVAVYFIGKGLGWF